MGMIEINLLPTNLRPRSQSTQKKTPTLAPVPKAFPLALIGLTLLMAMLILVSNTRVGTSQRRSRQVQAQLEAAKDEATEAEQRAKSLPTTAAQYSVLAERLSGKVAWAEVLRAISLRCPDRVRLTSIKLERDRHSGRPIKLVISGEYSGSSSLEMLFAGGLQESATLTGIFEAVLSEKELMDDGSTRFAISCIFRPYTDALTEGIDEGTSR
jgi:Tfp pilus assembly protein PilN